MNLRIKKYNKNLIDISIIDEVVKFNNLNDISLDIGSGEGEFITEFKPSKPMEHLICDKANNCLNAKKIK